VPTPVPGAVLPFEVITSGIHPMRQRDLVGLYFVTDPAEADPVLVDAPELNSTLLATDFDQYAVIVLMRRPFAETGHDMVLEQVILHDDTLIVYVKLIEPGPGAFTGPGGTSGGYVVATIPWDGPSADEIKSELVTYTDYWYMDDQ
jgi:hypothetical protein